MGCVVAAMCDVNSEPMPLHLDSSRFADRRSESGQAKETDKIHFVQGCDYWLAAGRRRLFRLSNQSGFGKDLQG
jgi:hypothetical protein